jgi:hypothetical protein
VSIRRLQPCNIARRRVNRVRGDGILLVAEGLVCAVVARQCVRELEVDAGRRVRDAPLADGVAELVDCVQNRRRCCVVGSEEEFCVAGAIAGVGLARAAGCQSARSGVDAEYADEVGAKVGDDEKFARRVDVGLVGVGDILAGVGTVFSEGKLFELEGLGVGGEGELVCGDC